MPAHYSYSWARSVIQGFTNKYARATNLAWTFLGITSEDAAKYLARGDPVWPQIRILVHIIDNWELSQGFGGWDATAKSLLRLTIARKGYKRLAERLAKIGDDNIIKEQATREVLAVAPATAGTNLTLPFEVIDVVLQ